MNPRLEPLLAELEKGCAELARRTLLLRSRLNAYEAFQKTGVSTLAKDARRIHNLGIAPRKFQ
jgi:hypothetical protein